MIINFMTINKQYNYVCAGLFPARVTYDLQAVDRNNQVRLLIKIITQRGVEHHSETFANIFLFDFNTCRLVCSEVN